MDRLFLDANVLFSAAYREEAGVRRLWDLSHVERVTSTYAAEEAHRNLGTARQRRALADLLEGVRVVTVGTLARERRAGIALPDKDWPILAGAMSAECTHLITGDLRHFGQHLGRALLGVRVMTPAQYLRASGAPSG